MNSVIRQQRALITGASSGIGKETALAFAKAGINLVLIGRNQQKLAAVAAMAADLGVSAQAYPLDLADIPEVASRIAKIAQESGPIDILINNAGMGYTNPLADTPLSDWQRVIDLNLTSVYQCVQGILPAMRQQGGGTIINVSSIAADNFFPDWGAYSVSKAALVAFSRILAIEERVNAIRVTIITPGAVNTPIWDSDSVKADFDRSAMLTPDIIAQAILQAVLLPKQAVVETMTIMPSAGAL
ncbi:MULTISPECIES: SDR family oxidoreductase [Microcystis]|uniref:SDR family oxidoreductase n=3 Tax=Microcystis TaxID=1125 RepID=A0A841UTY4_MICAE|nr:MULTISPECIES: SDR family oxidoreductase [Microcystis]TRU35784.1 MAG: SDR family oxidoreductase [Microcystis aeruginosa Ma_MB_F_20061100_S20]TRU39289.1 MAG: SDR family oxidoreductase [Microcystis aeruginosa Ma_MB_F_20061100_S20D]AKV69170.1 Sepiapterin reductase [Microcystis panniformis FACHB-1757]MBC1192389.1 SDR family oxidoreductase [Microcystis aeruginosa BLCC-F108]MCA2589509.1 SDR family oxidoreductase [Microcystis sp. M31BS1]